MVQLNKDNKTDVIIKLSEGEPIVYVNRKFGQPLIEN